MPRISVIVPVYMVEKYLKVCLESILNQTFSDIEIICVNDASPDFCEEILEEYRLKDSRIKIFSHEQNEGLGQARNTGLSHAVAEYISFIDSDDYIAPDFLETLYNLITKNNAQISWCGINTVSETGEFLNSSEIPEKVWKVDEMLNCESLYPGILPLWNKMFLRILMKDIKQLPIVSEDQPVLGEYFLQCDTIVTTSQKLYNYRQRNNTLSKPIELKPELWHDFFYSHELFFDFLKSKYTLKKDLRKQAVLRHFSILWRINAYKILFQSDWNEHEKELLKHLRADKIGLKQYSSVMYFFLIALFNSNFHLKVKKIWIEIGMQLSRSKWLRNTNWFFLPFDILGALRPLIIFNIRSGLDLIEFFCFKCFAALIKLFIRKPIWIIGERPDTAQDNGFYFFMYLIKNQRQIKAYYIIDKKSTQFSHLEKTSDTIHPNSIKHKLYFLICNIYATSHNHYCIPVTFFGRRRYRLAKNTRNIFLQHGITYSNNSDIYGKANSSITLFICGAKPEYEYISREFGYSLNEVKYTGFARFDGLHDFTVRRYILLMPTWRRKIWENLLKNNVDYFLHSKYYQVFQSLINDPDLHNLLTAFDFQLIFYPHYEIQPYLNMFATSSDRIILAAKSKYSVQELLKSSALLITDSSSVNFDFAYMKKPLIYYFFDREDFLTYHLRKGYFDHESMGFGPVVKSKKSLLLTIESYLKNDFKMEDKFSNRVQEFFPLYDMNNCERIYKEIMILEEK